MIERDLNARELGRLADVNPNAIYNFLSRRSTSLSPDTLERLAAVLPGETVSSLQGVADSRAVPYLTVRSVARAAEWRRTFELPEREQERLPFPLNDADRIHGSFGIRVEDPGAEEIFPAGTVLVCVPISRWDGELAPRLRVIVQALRGDVMEITVREVQRAPDGSFWMRLRTSDPRFQHAVRLPASHLGRPWRDDSLRLSVIAVVTGYLVREIRFASAIPAGDEAVADTAVDGAELPKGAAKKPRTKKPPRRKPRGL